jgi:hypothetical protein
MAYDCPHCQKAIPDAIPKERFDEIYNERKTLKTQLDEVQKNGKSADALALALQAREKELADTRLGYSLDLTMRDAKIEDEATRTSIRDVMEWQYSRLPEADRPPLQDIAKTWLTEPDKAPLPVRSLIPKAAAPVATQQAASAADAAKPNGAAPLRPGFARHTNGLEGSGTTTAFQPGSLRAKLAAGTLTQADIDAAANALSGKQTE